MSLQQKIIKIFDVYIPEGTSNEAIILELGRRGKLDIKKLTIILFLLVDEIEELKNKKK